MPPFSWDRIIKTPFFGIHLLPPEETEAATFVWQNLHRLSTMVDRLGRSMALYEHAERLRAALPKGSFDIWLYHHWAELAARAGAIEIHGSFMIMQAISQDLLWQCPTVMAAMDAQAKSDAYVMFEKSFPGMAKIRNISAHPETASTPSSYHQNATADDSKLEGARIESGTVFIGSGIVNGAFILTADKKVVSYRPGQEAVEALAGVAEKFNRAFDPVAAAIEDSHRKRGQSGEPPNRQD